MQTSRIHWFNAIRGYEVHRTREQPALARQCGSCTACCQGWLKGSIRGHDMHAGRPCHYVATDGCSIYDSRPTSPCRSFSCGWQAMPRLFPENFRPDQSGFIVKVSTWDEFEVFMLVSAGKDPQADHLAWMTQLCQSTGIPFFYEINGETSGYGPGNFVARLNEYQQMSKPLW